MQERPYIARILDAELASLVGAVPAISLEGPKGVGKTATAARLAATVRRLDVPAQRVVVAADPHLALAGRRVSQAGSLTLNLSRDIPSPARMSQSDAAGS